MLQTGHIHTHILTHSHTLICKHSDCSLYLCAQLLWLASQALRHLSASRGQVEDGCSGHVGGLHVMRVVKAAFAAGTASTASSSSSCSCSSSTAQAAATAGSVATGGAARRAGVLTVSLS